MADGFIPENLKTAIVRPEYFDTGTGSSSCPGQ